MPEYTDMYDKDNSITLERFGDTISITINQEEITISHKTATKIAGYLTNIASKIQYKQMCKDWLKEFIENNKQTE